MGGRAVVLGGLVAIVLSGAGRVSAEDPWRLFAGAGQRGAIGVVAPQRLDNVYGIEVTRDAIFFSTVDDHSIWKSNHAGTRIERIAGTGKQGYSGDGGPAAAATFNAPHEIRVDTAGNLYIADTRNHCVRVIGADDAVVRTIAGDGVAGFRGEGAAGSVVRFNQPHSIALDGAGGLLVADTKNHRLRRIDLETNRVTTVSGDGRGRLPVDGKRAAEVSLFGPRSLAVDDDAIWMVLREGNSVWRIDKATSQITRVAGTGKQGHTGDGGDPRQATFRGPKGIAVDGKGNLVIVDTENHAVRYVDRQAGLIETLPIGFPMKRPHGAAVLTRVGKPDVILVSDSEHDRVLAGRREAR